MHGWSCQGDYFPGSAGLLGKQFPKWNPIAEEKLTLHWLVTFPRPCACVPCARGRLATTGDHVSVDHLSAVRRAGFRTGRQAQPVTILMHSGDVINSMFDAGLAKPNWRLV